MQLPAFRASLEAAAPPSGLSAALQALWWDGHQAWEKAHACVSDDDGRDAAWVHAYLHRKESDLSNARYWYNRAGRPLPRESPAAEWDSIATALLDERSAGAKDQ